MPASQISLTREENLSQFLTQMLTCEVLEVDREKKRILLSRRTILEGERETERKEIVGKFSSGQTVKGRVTRVEPSRSRIALSRLDPRGAMIGAEDSVETAVIDTAMKANESKPIGTNLGNLFKKLKVKPSS